MVIKNLENKIKLVGIICTAFLIGCILISVSSIWTARTMVTDAQKKVYVRCKIRYPCEMVERTGGKHGR